MTYTLIYSQEKDENLSGDHAREGLTCVVAVKVPNPEFEGQTKVSSSFTPTASPLSTITASLYFDL